MVEAKAKLSRVGISPKKIRLVADAIRGLDVPTALARLEVVFKRSAPVIAKLVKSAVANAQNKFDVKTEDLMIKTIMVDKSFDLKRWRPAAFGSAHPLRKHSSHVEIVVASRAGAVTNVKEQKEEKIDTVDLTKTEKKAAGPSVDTTKKKENRFHLPKRGTKIAKGKDNINVKKG